MRADHQIPVESADIPKNAVTTQVFTNAIWPEECRTDISTFYRQGITYGLNFAQFLLHVHW